MPVLIKCLSLLSYKVPTTCICHSSENSNDLDKCIYAHFADEI